MPDDKRPDEDRLADLFGKLPDPRRRTVEDRPEREGSAPASAPPPSPSPSTPPRSPSSSAQDSASRQSLDPPIPLSRREMRQRAATGTDAGAREAAAARPRSAHQESGPDEVRVESAATLPPSSAPESTSEPGAMPATPTMTLEKLFAEEERFVPSKTEKRRNRRIGGWIALGVVLVLLGGIGIGTLWIWNAYEAPIRSLMGWEEPRDYEPGVATGEALVTISAGDGGQAISQTLYEAGVTKTPGAFYAWLLDLDAVPIFYPGVYRLQQQMTSEAALAALENPENKLENSALVREGLTVEQTLPLLADGIGLPIEDFQAAVADPAAYGVAAPSLEGWLFPATYTFDPDVTAEQVIQAMVDQAVQSLDAAGVPVDERQRILTIASIIQREARETDDFYKVSRVIQNRLQPGNPETFGKLQMDSTAQYGYEEMHDGTVSTSAEALEDDNPWNTYKIEGLPAGPIANPGDVAIDAAMNPVEGTWLYFVTVNLETGETVFTDTYAQHQKAIEQWQQWCADNPDGGC